MTDIDKIVATIRSRQHQFRTWADGPWNAAKKPKGEPCGDCGKDRSVHPIGPTSINHDEGVALLEWVEAHLERGSNDSR